MSSVESPETAAADADEDSTGARRDDAAVPTALRADEDKIVSQLNDVNDELVSYTFRMLEQCVTLSDAVTEINQVQVVIGVIGATLHFESSDDCHRHFFKVEFAYFHIKIPIFRCTLEFGQENNIFPATRNVLWPKTCRNAIAAGALRRTPLGKLTTLSRTP